MTPLALTCVLLSERIQATPLLNPLTHAVRLDSKNWPRYPQIHGVGNDGKSVAVYSDGELTGTNLSLGYVFEPFRWQPTLAAVCSESGFPLKGEDLPLHTSMAILEGGLRMGYVRKPEWQKWYLWASEWYFWPVDSRVSSDRVWRLRLPRLSRLVSAERPVPEFVKLTVAMVEPGGKARARLWEINVRLPFEAQTTLPLTATVSRQTALPRWVAMENLYRLSWISPDLCMVTMTEVQRLRDIRTGRTTSLPGDFGRLFFWSGRLYKSVPQVAAGPKEHFRPGVGLWAWVDGRWQYAAELMRKI